MKEISKLITDGRLAEIRRMMWEIPFGNTRFQIENFLREYTPERQLRMILLQLNEKVTSLEKYKLNQLRVEMDLEELRAKIELAEGNARKRLEIDLLERQMDEKAIMKLVHDTMEEVKIYDQLLLEVQNQVGEISRDKFELAEQKYWELRLLDDARANMTGNGSVDRGTLQSLQKIGLTAIRQHDGISFLTQNDLKMIEEKETAKPSLE